MTYEFVITPLVQLIPIWHAHCNKRLEEHIHTLPISSIVLMKTLFRAARPAAVFATIAVMLSVQPASAVPELQLYIEGATYDATTETWEADISSSGTLRLWTIGNVSGPGSHGALYDVKLAIAYQHGDTPTFVLTSSTTGGLGGFFDPSTPGAATYIQTVTDGSAPLLGDGSVLPNHGEYGAGTDWQ